MHLAVRLSQEDIVKLLMQGEANPNIQDSQGNTALHLAVKSNNIAITDLLLKEGVQIPIYQIRKAKQHCIMRSKVAM